MLRSRDRSRGVVVQSGGAAPVPPVVIDAIWGGLPDAEPVDVVYGGLPDAEPANVYWGGNP